MEWTRIIAERQIRDAMDNGDFDNLPGRGKPLENEEDLSIPPHLRAVARVLHNAGALPDWMQAERDIARETEAAGRLRARGLRSMAHARSVVLRERIAARLRKELREQMGLVNTLILKYNLIAPAGYQRAFLPFRIADELADLEAELARIPSL